MTTPLIEPLGGFGRLFSSIDSKRGGTVHQFGSTLPLQGEISLGGGEVMQVTATEPGFLRAQSYDFYTAQGWKIGSASQITTSTWPALRALQGPEDARRQLRRPLSVQITTTKRSNVLVSPGQPVAVNIDSRVVFGPDQSDVTSLRPTGRLNENSQYRVDGTVSNASVQRLQAAPPVYPPWIDAYLQLPSDLPQIVAAKAREVTSGAPTAYDKANLLEQYLRTIPVDTKIKPAPAKRDSVAYFLFDAGRGYFDYHASAMVVMLRSLGVPARMTVGYVTRAQDRMPDTNTYVVSDANSFAWPEVYFAGLGWVEFNPTPSEPRILRSGSDDQQFFESDPTEEEEEDLFPTGDIVPSEEATEALDQLQIEEGSSLASRIIMTVVLLFLGVTVAGGTIFHYGLQHGLGGVAYPIQTWEKVLRLGRWTHIRPNPQETPREVMARLKKELPEVEDLDYLGETFIRARYGQKDLEPAERQRLTAVWNKVRNTLMARMVRWK
jgi:transglutaminase-like putative cysteine protease